MVQSLTAFQKFLDKHLLGIPKAHVVLGSGFGSALDNFSWENIGDLSFSDVPGLHVSTVPDHAGKYRFYRHPKKHDFVVVFQMGRLHGYEGHDPKEVVQTVMIPRVLGVENFLLTNAAGGLSVAYRPGDVLMIRDHVNFTGKNPLTGPNPILSDGRELGPRFPDMCDLYDKEWRANLGRHCEREGLRVHEGVYLGISGPSFETPAEVQLFAAWGMGAVGMSTVWEAIALKHSGARVAGLSLISNLGAGMGGEKLDHLEILKTCRSSASQIMGAIQSNLEEFL